jgi:hypothetical protein
MWSTQFESRTEHIQPPISFFMALFSNLIKMLGVHLAVGRSILPTPYILKAKWTTGLYSGCWHSCKTSHNAMLWMLTQSQNEPQCSILDSDTGAKRATKLCYECWYSRKTNYSLDADIVAKRTTMLFSGCWQSQNEPQSKACLRFDLLKNMEDCLRSQASSDTEQVYPPRSFLTPKGCQVRLLSSSRILITGCNLISRQAECREYITRTKLFSK